MSLSPANALTRTLSWSDYTQRSVSAPAPGTFALGAETRVTFGGGSLSVVPVPGARPQRFKLASEPTITVTFDAQSWVASFVSSWPQANQDALLAHEQTHYLIAALSARDFSNELAAIAHRDYPTSSAVATDVKASQARFTAPLVQAIQDKYDADTHHDPVGNKTVQATWNTTVLSARTLNQPLRTVLKTANLI